MCYIKQEEKNSNQMEGWNKTNRKRETRIIIIDEFAKFKQIAEDLINTCFFSSFEKWVNYS